MLGPLRARATVQPPPSTIGPPGKRPFLVAERREDWPPRGRDARAHTRAQSPRVASNRLRNHSARKRSVHARACARDADAGWRACDGLVRTIELCIGAAYPHYAGEHVR